MTTTTTVSRDAGSPVSDCRSASAAAVIASALRMDAAISGVGILDEIHSATVLMAITGHRTVMAALVVPCTRHTLCIRFPSITRGSIRFPCMVAVLAVTMAVVTVTDLQEDTRAVMN
jgi:hypothetical protein